MTYATPPVPDLHLVALALASASLLASGAMADSAKVGATAVPEIVTEQDASDYVMGILSEAGCRMRFAAFQERIASDGLSAPSGAAGDPATLVAAAPLRLLNAGLIAEDPGDPQILISSGPGCD